MMKRIPTFILSLIAAVSPVSTIIAQTPKTAAAKDNTLVERVGSTGILQLHADSFKTLTPRQQILTYYLTQAAIAVDPIIYDQSSRFGLRQKRILEAIVARPGGVDPTVSKKISDFTKLFWANGGNHNSYTAQKFL